MLAARGKHKIRPPRKTVHGEELDFNKEWGVLADALTQIHTKNASQLSYENLYRTAYKIVLKKEGGQLYENVKTFETSWLVHNVLPRIKDVLPASLLAGLENITNSGTSDNEKRTAGERVMRIMNEAFSDHQTCMAMLADVLMYMERVYCTDQHCPSIYSTCMDRFKAIILCSPAAADGITVLDYLIRIILAQIRIERAGDIIDKHLVKSSSSMLDSVFETVEEKDDQRLYHTRFEPEFLQRSRQFYAQEATRMLVECNAGAYCSITKKRISEELDRCSSTLIESTGPKIVEVVEDELIRNKIKDLIDSPSGLRFMVDNNMLDQLADIFELNARVDERKAELVQGIQKKIIEQGTEINSAAAAAAQAQPSQALGDAAEGSADRSKAPVEKSASQATAAALTWVEEVLSLKDRYDTMYRRAFQSDEVLQTALTRSFMDFINSPLFPRSSEYISLFIDENMKKGIKGKTEHEIDLVLDKAITLLKYVQDKDMFERYYKKHLCRRLLMNKSVSIEVEKQMIGRMKIELGNSFTSKMEAMFKDMAISEELTAGFKSHVAQLGDADPRRIELGVHILTSMTWPLETMGSTNGDDENKRQNCVFPPAVERVKLGFEKFYAEKHSGRQLKWLANMGTADIKAVFPKVQTKEGTKERRHELNVSTYAMVILLQFNDLPANEKLSFEEIQARTNIPTHDLIRNLQSLAVAPKTRILLKEPMSRDVKPTDMFSFNEGFVGKFVKIKVGVVTGGNKVENEKERKDTEEKNDANRAFAVEAAIVRIMKQRKKLTHTSLVTEVLEQLKTFKPDIPMIKKRIESLIEREYLERVENAKTDTYSYLA